MSAPPETMPVPGRTHALQYAFTAHIRDPERQPAPDGIEDRRMAIYRDLVYSNMESFVSSNFPVIRSLYNDANWSVFAHDFFREHRCHTPLFPEYLCESFSHVSTPASPSRGTTWNVQRCLPVFASKPRMSSGGASFVALTRSFR